MAKLSHDKIRIYDWSNLAENKNIYVYAVTRRTAVGLHVYPKTRRGNLPSTQDYKYYPPECGRGMLLLSCFFFFFFFNKVKIMLIYDEPLLSDQSPLSCPSAYSEGGQLIEVQMYLHF